LPGVSRFLTVTKLREQPFILNQSAESREDLEVRAGISGEDEKKNVGK
jgi:hypothetical protein